MSSIGSLFGIGLTSMRTVNQLLDTAEHNIANANTPGYSLQQATVQSIPTGQITTTGASGSGVQVTDIQRIYSSFINSQLNIENSNLSYWNNYQTGITQVEDLFNEAQTSGISPEITSFFNDWQNVAQSPQDQSQRTTLIQQANDLSSRLSSAAAGLQQAGDQLLTDSQSLVNQVNSDSAQIADLNLKISGNSGALDLQDQRDKLLQSLNQIVKVSTFQDSTGMDTVMVGGTPLVEGGKSFNMDVQTDTADKMHFYVTLESGALAGSSMHPDVTSSISGGQIKANLDLRDTDIPGYSNQLNAFAVNLANLTNYYQKQGYDLNGLQGANFFQPLDFRAKYTSVDQVAGVITNPAAAFSAGGKLTIKLGDNDTSPATVTVKAGDSLNAVVSDINDQAGSKVTASVVDLGSATAGHDYRISIKSNPDGNLGEVRIAVASLTANAGKYDAAGSGLNLLATGPGSMANSQSDPTKAPALIATSGTEVSSVGVTNPTAVDANAQYKIDYVNTDTSYYQADGVTPNTSNFANVAQAFNVDSTHNTIVFSYGGTSYTAILTSGSYTGSGMAAEIQKEMRAVAGNHFTVDYNKTLSNAFTIQADAGTTISWGTSSVSSQELGFNAAQTSITAGNIPSGEGAVTFGDYQPEVNPPSSANPPSSVAGASTMFWRVMKSDDGSTWTSVNPNTSYDPSGSSVVNESEVNLTSDFNKSTPSYSAFFTRTLEFEGVKVQIDGNGVSSATNPNGETFDVRLDPNAASDITTLIADPNQLAASTDTFNVDSSNNTLSFNITGVANPITATIATGNYTNDPGQSDDISSALVTAIQTAYQTYQTANGNTPTVLPDILNVVFNPNTKQFKIMMPNGSDTITLNWSTSTAGKVYGFSSDTAVTSGQSAVSDTPGNVLSSANQGVPGDNRNATAIAGLANGKAFGGTNPVDFYNTLVSNVGVKSAAATNNQQYTSSIVDQLTQRQAGVSGVSMDQEAANLVMYEKAYQAAAQMIQVGNTLLTTLMQIIHN